MISPHYHSGRRLPRGHTSYAALLMMVLVAGVLLLIVTSGAWASQQTVSGSVMLSGVWMGLPPATAPQIVSPVTGQSFGTLPIQVAGNCSSALLVEVYKNGVLGGVSNCQNNAFSLKMDLFIGQNDLVARQVDVFGQASPSSSVVRVNYNPINRATNDSKRGLRLVEDRATQLIISTDMGIKGVDLGQVLDWDVSLFGGKVPYALNIDWGDGASDLASVAGAERFTGKHTYREAGRYKITFKASDGSGQVAYLEVLAIVRGVAPPPVGGTKPADGGKLLVLWPVYLLLVFMLISFWLGEKYEKRKLDQDFNLGI